MYSYKYTSDWMDCPVTLENVEIYIRRKFEKSALQAFWNVKNVGKYCTNDSELASDEFYLDTNISIVILR